MNKDEFMREFEKALGKISEAERAEILYDYEEHFMIGKENGKTEEEICLELGSPKEIANNYLLNHANESMEDDIKADVKDENDKNSPLVSGYNRRKAILGSGLIVAALVLFITGISSVLGHDKSNILINGDEVKVGGIRIDSSGIHGNGISIDSNGVKVPGVSVDSNGVKVPGVRVDSNGVKMPGVRVDSNGVKVPGVSVDSNGVKVPGVSVDSNGVKVDLPDVKVNIED